MGTKEQDVYLDRIEWEGLQNRIIIKENINSDFLKDTANKIEIWRGEDYKIRGEICGIFNNDEDRLSYDTTSGEIIKPIEITGENHYGTEKYSLKHCYIGNQNIKTKIVANGHLNRTYDAELITYHVERKLDIECDISWITDWYINSHRMSFLYPRSTKRSLSESYTRSRCSEDEECCANFRGFEGTSDAMDYALINCGKLKFIIHSIPKKYQPNWSEKLGIEYRREFGIPDTNTREYISEIISFIIGKQLLHIGSSNFDSNGYPIEETFFNPKGDNIMAICQKNQIPPIVLDRYNEIGKIELVLQQVIPTYLEVRDELQLNEALYRYWIANNLPIGTNLPILASGIEIIASAWFKSKKSKVKGVYLPKKEFDSLLKDELIKINEKLKNIEYGDRINNRIRNTFNLGVNERLQFFFDEIGLELGEVENKAIRARNIMTHSSTGDSYEEIKEMIDLTNAYKTLFNRVFLKILSYNGKYIDYSVIGNPEKDLNKPLGNE